MGKSNRDPENGSGDQEPEVADGVRAGAEPSAPAAPIADEPPPVRQPVSLTAVAEEEAIAIATPAIAVAAAIVGEIDSYPYVQLVSRLVAEIRSGTAAGGVQVTAMCAAAYTGRGHLPDLYTPQWELVADLATRLIVVAAGRRVLFEDVYTIAAEISRSHNGLGTHHNQQAARAMHFIGNALAAADRHTTSSAIPLLIGTRDDQSSPDADGRRIAAFAVERGRSLPTGWSQHLEELLTGERKAAQAVFEARSDLPRLLNLNRWASRPRSLPARGSRSCVC